VHRVSLKKLPFTILSQPGEEQQEAGSDDEEQEAGSSGEDEDEEQPSGSGSSGSEGGDKEGDEGEEEAAPLDAFPSSTAAAVEAFAAAVEADPAAFLQPTAELAGLAKAAAKALYDYQATCQGGASSSGGSAVALPELYIDGFDAEQIWLQLELAAGPALKRARKLLKKAGEEPMLLTPKTEDAIDGGLTLGRLGGV
jgi:U3 small nucleolar RNA-associated protein MPP10